MKAVIQRVLCSSVTIDNNIICEIKKGLTVLVGFKQSDNEKILNYFFNKIINLRIFEDENRKMNKSLLDIDAEILIVPQFTLYANCNSGRRPDWTAAAPREQGKILFEKFIDLFHKNKIKYKNGIFQTAMIIKIYNDGPVTIILDSEELCQ